VVRAIGVGQDSRVDAVSPIDRTLFRSEVAVWSIRDGHTNAEDTLRVLGREEQIELAILLGRVRCP
jgi:hypothetical protein